MGDFSPVADAFSWVTPAVVVDVHDGDTFRVRVDLGYGITKVVDVRLDGVDTPELAPPLGRAGREDEKAKAIDAREVTATWLHRGPFLLHSQAIEGGGKFGRVLAGCSRDGDVDLTELLLAQGLATAWPTRWHEVHGLTAH